MSNTEQSVQRAVQDEIEAKVVQLLLGNPIQAGAIAFKAGVAAVERIKQLEQEVEEWREAAIAEGKRSDLLFTKLEEIKARII